MHERLLHTAWAELAFSLQGLMTTRGDRLEIVDPGALNHGAGPDFGMTRIRLAGLELCGSTEIHLRSSDWYRHGHQNDAAYNNVILHAVLEDDLEEDILLQDGTRAPTFCIKPHISPSFRRLMELGSSKAIPCSGQIRFISDKVIEDQLVRAGREYFEEKAKNLLQNYNEKLPLTDAWKNLLLFALFDHLGLPSNRRPMVTLLEKMLEEAEKGNKMSTSDALRLSGLYISSPGGMKIDAWDLKACRPASSPNMRIPQAMQLFHNLQATDIRSLPVRDLKESWAELAGTWNGTQAPGADTLTTCFYTAYLPCIYILGTLIHDVRLQGRAYALWKTARLPFARSINKPLAEADTRFRKHRDTPGGLHQYRSYCRNRRCDVCGIFSALISA